MMFLSLDPLALPVLSSRGKRQELLRGLSLLLGSRGLSRLGGRNRRSLRLSGLRGRNSNHSAGRIHASTGAAVVGVGTVDTVGSRVAIGISRGVEDGGAGLHVAVVR